MWTDRQTDVGHINLIGGLVTRNPPKKSVAASSSSNSGNRKVGGQMHG